MARRAKTGGKAGKVLRRGAAKRGSAPATAHRNRSTNVGLREKLEEARRQLREAAEQQTAASEVLKAISRSRFDLNAVLQVLIENATRLAGAKQGFIFRMEGNAALLAHSYNASAAYR